MNRTLMNTPANQFNQHMTQETAYELIDSYLEMYNLPADKHGAIFAAYDQAYELTGDTALGVSKALQAVWAEVDIKRPDWLTVEKPDCACTDEAEECDETTSNPVGVWLFWSCVIFAFVLGYYLGGRN